MTQKKYYYIQTYGCQMNENDSERLAGQLRSAGYEATEEMICADLILLNTCCVRESAEKKIYGKIGELKRLKQNKPSMILGVTGCMAQKDREKIIKKAPHIDLVMGTHNVHKLGELLEEIEHSKSKVVDIWEEAERASQDVPTIRKGQISAWVPIAYGCNNFCTYCIVPYVRGRERSRTMIDILREIESLGAEGYKEITLLGQNVNSYGKDLAEKTCFTDLLREVDQIETIERVRYMTSHPRDMNKELISTVRDSRKICKHFHLPIQSGSDAILTQMNRGYTTAYYRELVDMVREMIPDASITTDIIVGFPGETDEMFQETLEFIRSIQFDYAYTFLYSKRSGTPAANMSEQIELLTKKQRLQELMNLQNEISLAINQKLEHSIVEVMVEGSSKSDINTLMGRTSTNKIILWKSCGNEKVGQIVKVKINTAQTWVLKGEIITTD